jgi:hypothetical protein
MGNKKQAFLAGTTVDVSPQSLEPWQVTDGKRGRG